MNLEFDLPTPFIYKIAQPWILYKGRLFQAGKQDNSLNDNYANLNGTKYAFNEIESLKNLDELYFQKNAQTVQRFQEQYMRTAANTEFRSKEAIEEELGKNKVISLLVTKILPIITNFSADDQVAKMIDAEEGVTHKATFIEAMAEKVRTGNTRSTEQPNQNIQRETRAQKQLLLGRIANEYKSFEIDPRRTPRRSQQNEVMDQLSRAIETRRPNVHAQITELNEESILGTHIFPEGKIMCYNGIHSLVTPQEWIGYFEGKMDARLYSRIQRMQINVDPEQIYQLLKDNKQQVEKRHLSRIMNKLRSSNIKIDNKYYFPIFMPDDKLEDIVQHHKKLLEKQVKISAIEHNEFQAVQMVEIARQREQLSRIANLEKFELNGAGYEKKDSRYYVFITTPNYALKSPHINDERKYKEFPPAKIGVEIQYDNYEHKFVILNPVVMNRYSHPFLPQGSEGNKQICLGKYNPSHAKGLPADKAILELLTKAKENLLMGYRTGSNPYRRLEKANWDGWITKRDVERKGLICLNDFD